MAFSLKDLAERALWTAVQAAGGTFGAASLAVPGPVHASTWAFVGTAAGIAALVSVAKTLGITASTVATVAKDATVAVDVVRPLLPAPVAARVDSVERVVTDLAGQAETALSVPSAASVVAKLSQG